MKKWTSLVFGLLCFLQLHAQQFTISGYIEDAATAEKLVAANVFDELSYQGTVTNTFGFYSLTMDAGPIVLSSSYIGYQDFRQEINLTENITIDIKLSAEAALEVVEIVAKEQKNIAEETAMSTVEVPIVQIKKIPALLGEVDVLKALQLLPGVQSGGEGQSGLYVRGGSPDQNLVLLDGVPVYNVSHLFGFFSVFNADAIKDVKLIKGGFPARYGGRLSSVLEINMKDGNMNEIHGSGSVGLIASRLTLEGPINKGKTSFIVSGRRTYADLIFKPFIKQGFRSSGSTGDAGYFFYDLNAKVNHVFSKKDRLYLSFYGGNDKFFFNEKDDSGNFRDYTETSLGWGNVTSALRWNHLWTPKLFSNTTLTFSRYKLNTDVAYGTEIIDIDAEERTFVGYDSGIDDIAAKIDFDFIPQPNHFIRFGFSAINHRFFPGQFTLEQVGFSEEDFFEELGQEDVSAQEFDLYVEDDIKLTEKFKANVGVHFSGFNVRGKFYGSAQPRLSTRYLLSDNQSLKFSFSTMRQFVHLLAFEGIGLPTDLWLPTTDRILPQESWQVAAGYAFKLSKKIDVTVEGYYKEMKNLIAYKEGSGLFELSDWEDRITQGDGKSYGAEIFIQKRTGRLSGWLGYTLSWTNRQFDDLNFGNEFPYKFDRRHDLSIVGVYELSDQLNLSATWVYGTGNAVTLANSTFKTHLLEGDFRDRTAQADFYTDRNNYRLRAYHRFDIGINFVKKREKYTGTWSLGAYNMYNRKNPFFIFTEQSFEENPDTGQLENTIVLKQASLFPIIPYLSYSFEF